MVVRTALVSSSTWSEYRSAIAMLLYFYCDLAAVVDLRSAEEMLPIASALKQYAPPGYRHFHPREYFTRVDLTTATVLAMSEAITDVSSVIVRNPIQSSDRVFEALTVVNRASTSEGLLSQQMGW